jgi:hypothetical protein
MTASLIPAPACLRRLAMNIRPDLIFQITLLEFLALIRAMMLLLKYNAFNGFWNYNQYPYKE